MVRLMGTQLHGGVSITLGHPAAPAPAAENPFSLAVRTNTLGAGFAGSGFLIFYFTGVTAILRQLGIMTKTTRLAGASSGAINAAQACSDTPPQRAFEDNLDLVFTCKPQRNCQGILDRALNATLSAKLAPDAGRLCAGRLWVSITVAKPDSQPDVNLLETQWASRQELASTLRLSSYLPGISAPSATLLLADRAAIGAGYDGGFTRDLPCPPGVKACVKVSANPLGGQGGGDGGLEAAVQQYNQLASATPALQFDPNTGPYIPLNPVATPTPAADIYPGISGPLPVNVTTWRSFSFGIPDISTLKDIYDVGRRDAGFWAKQQGLASDAAVAGALQATQVQLVGCVQAGPGQRC